MVDVFPLLFALLFLLEEDTYMSSLSQSELDSEELLSLSMSAIIVVASDIVSPCGDCAKVLPGVPGCTALSAVDGVRGVAVTRGSGDTGTDRVDVSSSSSMMDISCQS